MDFGISEEQELLQETVRGYIENECPVTTLREIYDSESGYDPKLREGLVEMGIAGLITPEEFGGVGMEVLDMALVAEMMGEGALPTPFLGHSMATLAILEGGSDEQKQRWLPDLAAGKLLATVAIGELPSENGECWEPASSSVGLEAGGLSGIKAYVPHASFADLAVVTTRGGGLAIASLTGSGVKIEPIDTLDRTRPLGKIIFENAAAEELPNGQETAPRMRDLGLILLAADAFGGASKLTKMCIDYAKVRKQFGTPIAQFQAVKHQIADMATDIEPIRALWWYAAHAFDHLEDKSEHAAALAKAHCTERSMEAARAAFELHGGIGYTWECDLQFWFKRAMFDHVFLGTPAHHLDRCAQLSGW